MRSCPAIRAHCRQGSVGMVHYVLNAARNPAGDQDRIDRQAVIQAASPVVQVVQTVLVWVLLRACAVSGLDLDCPFTFGGLGLGDLGAAAPLGKLSFDPISFRAQLRRWRLNCGVNVA